MSKKELRLFFASLFLTLLLCGWVAVFLAVDESSARFGGGSAAPALRLSREDPLRLDLALLGEDYEISLEPLNELEQARQEYACLLTPRVVLNAEQLYSLAVRGWRYFYNQYREREYLQNVSASQGGIPAE